MEHQHAGQCHPAGLPAGEPGGVGFCQVHEVQIGEDCGHPVEHDVGVGAALFQAEGDFFDDGVAEVGEVAGGVGSQVGNLAPRGGVDKLAGPR